MKLILVLNSKKFQKKNLNKFLYLKSKSLISQRLISCNSQLLKKNGKSVIDSFLKKKNYLNNFK